MQKYGQSLTEIKNQIIRKITADSELIRSLIIENEDFLDSVPNSEQNIILNNPDLLIRKQIMLTRNITAKTNQDMPYITSAYVNFKKRSNCYQNGRVYFYIIVPNSLEKTAYGVRYDWIGDKLDSIFSNVGIGKFEFYERGDLFIDQKFVGHYISFNILDFYGW